MIYYNMPNILFYILSSSILLSSILLYFLSKHVLLQERIKENYNEERNTCKFKFLTKRDKLIIKSVEYKFSEILHHNNIKFKFDKNKRIFIFETEDEIFDYLQEFRHNNIISKYKLDIINVGKQLQIKFLSKII